MKSSKEFLIKSKSSFEQDALAELFEAIFAYLVDHTSKPWIWRIRPETKQQSDGTWWAYARIELT